MDFEELKNKPESELNEVLAEQRGKLREARFKARSKQLKQFNTIANFRKTIARILTVLRQRQNKTV